MKRYGTPTKLVHWIALCIAVFIGLVFAACSPANKLSRLLNRHPDLVRSQVDSVYLPGTIETDTIHSYSIDTVITTSDSIFRRTDTFRFIERCRPGVITKTKTIYLPGDQSKKPTTRSEGKVRKAEGRSLGQKIDDFFTYVCIFLAGYGVASILSKLSRK